MKITSIDVIRLATAKKAADMKPIIVRVNSDEGFYGLGEGGLAIMTGAGASFEYIKEFAQMIIGRDPMETEAIWERLHKGTFWAIGNGAVVMSAISAIDSALWDLKARAMGVPLYVLLGGKQRSSLRAYASQLQFGWNVDSFTFGQYEPAYFAEMVQRAKAEGFTAVKANIITCGADGREIPSTEAVGLQSTVTLRAFEARLAAMRDAAGPDVDIILENHCRTDAVSAAQLAKIADPYNIMFLEEAASPMRPEAFKLLSEKTSIPLATGERTYTRWGFLPLISSGALALIQPDIGICGGISEVKKICDMAQTFDVGAQMHVCCSPISLATALQVEAAITNFTIHEHHMSSTLPCVTEMCVYDYQPVNGAFAVPDKPGIGQELSEKALREAEIVTIK
jgi:L-alanine-DL-glutamate epimerase-like enolase superfamily enzyme